MTFTNGKFFTSADRVQLDPDPFCQTLPFQLLFWNNSSWQEAAHCPRHHWYSTIRGLRRSGAGVGAQPVVGSVHPLFGDLTHQGADVYSKAVAAGADTELATEFALGHVLKASWPEGQELDVFGGHYGEVWQCSDRTRTNSKKGIVRCPWSKAEHLVTPEMVLATEVSEDPDHTAYDCPGCRRRVVTRTAYLCPEKIKNRRTLTRTIVALCDRMAAGTIKPRVLPDGRIGSEYRWFQPLAIESPDENPPEAVYGARYRRYHMTGSMDGVAEAPGTHTVIPEYKTTQREPDLKFWTGYEMSPQVHTYSWAGQKEFGPGTRLMLFAIHVGVGFTEVYPKTVYLSPAALQEWEGELAHKIQEFEIRARLASDLEKQGQNPDAAYPRNLAGCNSLPGASTTPCPFRDFCRLDPGDREAFLASNFEVAHHNPLGAKGTELAGEGDDT